MIDRFEKTLNQVHASTKPGLVYYLLLVLLSLSSFVLQACGALASLLPIRKTNKALVISVGSPFAGGTSKTPLTDLLIQELCKSVKVAILSRGYRSKAEHLKVPLILSEGKGPNFPACFAGDEALLLSRRNPKALAIVGKNRLKAAKIGEKMGAQVIVLDDGMQYPWLKKDFQIITVDAPSLIAKKTKAPLRLRRSTLASLSSADLIVVTETTSNSDREQACAKISRYSLSAVAFTDTLIKEALSFNSEETRPLKGAKIAVFCGIARPERFLQDLKRAGATVLATLFFPDHTVPNKDVLCQFAKDCKSQGADFLVCTEKDRVKLTADLPLALPLYLVKMELFFIKGQSHWFSFVEKALKQVKKSYLQTL